MKHCSDSAKSRQWRLIRPRTRGRIRSRRLRLHASPCALPVAPTSYKVKARSSRLTAFSEGGEEDNLFAAVRRRVDRRTNGGWAQYAIACRPATQCSPAKTLAHTDIVGDRRKYLEVAIPVAENATTWTIIVPRSQRRNRLQRFEVREVAELVRVARAHR
mgnify:CR=1 FL=1